VTRDALPTNTTVPVAGTLVEEARFAIVPEWVIDAAISDGAFRLYSLLLRYGNGSGSRMPSRQTLARRPRRSVDAIDRAMRQLTEAGIVRVEHRRNGEQFLSNRYHVRTTAPAEVATADGGGRTSAATPEPPTTGSRKSAAQPRDPYRQTSSPTPSHRDQRVAAGLDGTGPPGRCPGPRKPLVRKGGRNRTVVEHPDSIRLDVRPGPSVVVGVGLDGDVSGGDAGRAADADVHFGSFSFEDNGCSGGGTGVYLLVGIVLGGAP
jgi:hypothetical protein